MDVQRAILILREELRLIDRYISALERVPARRESNPVRWRRRQTCRRRNGVVALPRSGEKAHE